MTDDFGRPLPYMHQRMFRTHRRGRRPRRPLRRMSDDVGCTRQPTSAPVPMVRGLCPRDWMRGVVDVNGRTVSNAGAIGHAERVRLTRPGSYATRCVEDAAPYGRQLNVGIRIVVNKCVNAANLRPPLGSPERGAVAALCAVTEGLVPAWVQCNNVARQPHPTVGAGFHARPALVKGRRRTPVQMVRGLCPRDCIRWAVGARRARRG